MNTTITVVTRRNLVHSARDNTDDDHQFTVSLELHTSKPYAPISNTIPNLSQIINRFIFKVLTERIKRSVRSVVAAVAA